jgi:hypothetical protein
MRSKKPHKTEVADRQFPVRLTVLAEGTVQDSQNERTSRWLRTNLGESGYHVAAAITWSGKRAVHIHLPTVYDAAALLLACPHLRLRSESYEGPPR